MKSSESASLKNLVMKMNDYLQMDKKDFVMQMFFFHCLSLLSLLYFKGTDDKEILLFTEYHWTVLGLLGKWKSLLSVEICLML